MQRDFRETVLRRGRRKACTFVEVLRTNGRVTLCAGKEPSVLHAL